MFNIVSTEFKKLKRYNILLVGLIGMIFPSFLTVFTQAVASEGAKLETFQFPDLFNGFIWNSVSIFMPIIFTLIAGYIINREYTDGTLKNILTIPVSLAKLIGGKLLAMFFISILLALYGFVVTILVGLLVGLRGLTFTLILNDLIQTIGITMSTYIALLPIIAFNSKMEDGYMAGVVLSFVLAYSGMFIKGPFLRSIYPILAGFNIFNFDIAQFTNVSKEGYLSLSLLSIGISLLVSIFIVIFLKPKTKKSGKSKELFSREKI